MTALPRVVMVTPDPRNPGGITSVVASWRSAGLADAVELIELPTSAMDSPFLVKIIQADRALLQLIGLLFSPRRRPDLVHLHVSTGGSLLRKLVLAWACLLARVPYIAHEHSGELEEWIGSSRLRRAAAAQLYAGAALVIVLGERWRPLLGALGARQVEVLANGLSPSERAELARARVIRDALPATSPISGSGGKPPLSLLFYGRWAPKKGPDRLAAALRMIDRDDYELRLFGSGDRDWVERLFVDLPGRITIGGWLDPENKPAELGRAAALIAPSRAEGLPMALVEARAAGTPVIASEVGAVADALAGYPLALLLAPGDEDGLRVAIERVLRREWPADQTPDRFPDTLCSEHSVERLVGFYESVLGR